MRRRRNTSFMGSRWGRGLIGLMLIAWGLSAFGISIDFGLILLIGGLFLLWAMMRASQAASFSSRRADPRRADPFAVEEDYAPEETSPAARWRAGGGARAAASRASRMHRVAAQAVRRAGQNPDTLAVAPVDIGVLAYESREATPTLYRETRLPEDAAYIRPFMLLRSPRRARGRIRFELLDGQGALRFVDETEWELKAGETFVYPATWLPADRIEDFGGEWTLRVYAAETLLAAHEFAWWDSGGGDLRRYLTGDGEISDDLLEGLSGTHVERLSLDDLLDDQPGVVVEEDPLAEAAARRAGQLNRRRSRR